MTVPIQPPPPVNAVITIQPVTTTVPNRDSAPSSNPLSAVPSGTTVEGFVVNRDAQNNPILRTSLGDLKVTSDVFLKTGSLVLFKVDATVASLARILTVDGLSPQDYSAQSARGLTRDTISSSALQPTLPNAQTQAGKPTAPVLQAIILQPQTQLQAPSLLATSLAAAQSGPLPILAQLAQLRAGTQIKLRLLDLKLPPVAIALGGLPESNKLDQFLPPKAPAAQPQPARPETAAPTIAASITKPIATAATGAAAALSTSASGATTATPAQKPIATTITNAPAVTANVVAGIPVPEDELQPLKTAIIARQEAVVTQVLSKLASPLIEPEPAHSDAKTPATTNRSEAPPTNARNVSAQTVTQPSAPNQIVANVIGHDADGANILHTTFASLKIYTAQPLPTGTTLLVQAEIEPQLPQATATTAPLRSTSPVAGSSPLAVFDEAIAWLQTNQPDLAREVQLRLPNISHKLASGLLSYIAAIKGGNITEIFGKRAMRMMELDAPELFAKLRQSGNDMQRGLIDSPLQHWSAVPLPLLFGHELHQAQLYISKEPPEDKNSGNIQARGQRFVLELDVSEFGPMQFDGFIRERQNLKSFDLMVRTHSALPSDVNQGIQAIFTNSMQVVGMVGQVIFQHGRQHFIHPLAEMPGTPPGGGDNTILA